MPGQAGICLIFRGLFFKHNPREIGSAFHGAGAETCPPLRRIGQKDHLWMVTNLMVPFLHNRETGENPVRTRRCNRERKPQHATVHSETLISLLNGWEGAASRKIRESEDLPFRFCF
jgi:hypothetical protein